MFNLFQFNSVVYNESFAMDEDNVSKKPRINSTTPLRLFVVVEPNNQAKQLATIKIVKPRISKNTD